MTQHICAIEYCNKPAVGRGWCRAHYTRWHRYGDPLASAPRAARALTCTVEDCERDAFKRDLCQLHYHREQRKGSAGQAKPIKERGAVVAHIARRVPSMTPERCETEWPFSRSKGRPAAWDADRQRNVGAVHYAWYLLHGRWPSQLNHTCHDGDCWNPHHVYEGTQQENVRDMMEAGRYRGLSGAASPVARLTADQVREIRARYGGKYGQRRSLAREFGISESTIDGVLKGKTYRDCT
ncbi:hypothetical protein [Nocardia sp. SC052]|uniref:hypothetical protein n=1 Tax=Nocardia sichangensis TaxID=3385975 RepID=UPI0039A32D80